MYLQNLVISLEMNQEVYLCSVDQASHLSTNLAEKNLIHLYPIFTAL